MRRRTPEAAAKAYAKATGQEASNNLVLTTTVTSSSAIPTAAANTQATAHTPQTYTGFYQPRQGDHAPRQLPRTPLFARAVLRPGLIGHRECGLRRKRRRPSTSGTVDSLQNVVNKPFRILPMNYAVINGIASYARTGTGLGRRHRRKRGAADSGLYSI